MHQPTGWSRLFSIWNVPSTTGSDAGQVQQRWLRRRVCGRRHLRIHAEPVSAHDDGVPNIPCKSSGIHSTDRKLESKYTDSTELQLHRISEWEPNQNRIYQVKPEYLQHRIWNFWLTRLNLLRILYTVHSTRSAEHDRFKQSISFHIGSEVRIERQAWADARENIFWVKIVLVSLSVVKILTFNESRWVFVDEYCESPYRRT